MGILPMSITGILPVSLLWSLLCKIKTEEAPYGQDAHETHGQDGHATHGQDARATALSSATDVKAPARLAGPSAPGP